VQWRDRAPGLPNEREILLTSLLTIIAAPTVAQLNLWATDVDLEHSRYLEEKEQWEMPVAWRPPSKGKPSAIYEPIIDAFEACPPTETLEQIGKAMRSWRSAGHMAELTPQRIRDYFSEKLLGPAPDPSKPKRAPPRWRTPESLFGVAKLVKHRGVALRKLLKLEEERSDLPTIEESFEMAMELVEDTLTENEELRREQERLGHAHNTLLARNVDKRTAVSAAKAQVREQLKESESEKIAALKQKHSEALSTKEMEVEVLAEALAAREIEKHRKSVCVAQARARESLFNVELLLEKAQVECERRERELVTDTHEYMQPPTAPPFDAELVGKRLEICWPYKAHGKTQKIWASGVVKRVADGITDKRPRARTKLLEAGALLWAWDADPEYDEKAGEEWLLLKPKHFNKPVEYGWRFDPCEMGSHSAPRAPQIERGTTEDEFLRD
jgi:hypothetical protein